MYLFLPLTSCTSIYNSICNVILPIKLNYLDSWTTCLCLRQYYDTSTQKSKKKIGYKFWSSGVYLFLSLLRENKTAKFASDLLLVSNTLWIGERINCFLLLVFQFFSFLLSKFVFLRKYFWFILFFFILYTSFSLFVLMFAKNTSFKRAIPFSLSFFLHFILIMNQFLRFKSFSKTIII